jgi:hypothetical protein
MYSARSLHVCMVLLSLYARCKAAMPFVGKFAEKPNSRDARPLRGSRRRSAEGVFSAEEPSGLCESTAMMPLPSHRPTVRAQLDLAVPCRLRAVVPSWPTPILR